MIDGEREEFENAEPAVEVENPVESADDENEAPAEGDNAANAEPAKNAEGSADGEFRNDSEAAENGETGAQVEKFASTYMKKRDAITEALPVEVYRNEEDGRLVREVTHWLCDFDDSFAYVERSDWSRDNGYIETKGRFAYAFDEANLKATISGEFTEMCVVWLTKEESAQIDAMREQYQVLAEYKADRERADREAEYDDAISEFSYMSGNVEYDAVYANRYSYETIEAMKNACYTVKGKYSISAPQRRSVADPVIPVGALTDSGMSLVDRFNEEYRNK